MAFVRAPSLQPYLLGPVITHTTVSPACTDKQNQIDTQTRQDFNQTSELQNPMVYLGLVYVPISAQEAEGAINIRNCITTAQGSSTSRSCSAGNYLDITYGYWKKMALRCIVEIPFTKMDSNCNYPIGSSCTIYATNSWLGGNPCSGCTKSLVWYYSCKTIWGNWGSWSSCPGDCSTQSIVRYRSCVRPGGGCGTAPSQSMGCLRYGCTSSAEFSRSTPNDQVYKTLSPNCFLALGRTSFTFRAKANNDIHVLLNTVDSSSVAASYEAIIAGWANTKTELRIDGAMCAEHYQALLSQSWYDEFWISWSSNTIKMGTGKSVGSNTKLSCTHSPMYDIKYILIRTGWGSTGQWRFPNDVSCTHELNGNVNVPTSSTGCNGVSTYACNSGYKQVAGNTQRTCYGKFWTGYPLVCSVSTCKIDILFIIEASSYTSSIYSELVSVIGDLVRTMQISTSNIQVGVISYDNAIDQNFKFNVYTTAASLDTAITALTIPSASTTVNLAEALRVAFYDFFKLSNGNRFQAYKYFVIVGKSSPTNAGSAIGLNIRQVAKNRVFGI
ncbi:uncharacterized protein LOC134265330, partial [Saccostrea cucullata]|uniref:uncharacterized protein LOC134265330 n=1 Tax=Saccostrea cuccullata TaxID=36930 RepID=UPI002ED597F9